jgi:hypothetical protein
LADSSLLGRNDADTVALFGLVVYGIVAAACSSPQTAELNARARSATLMKWVKLGLVQAAVFVAVGVWMDKRRWPPLLGGGLAAAMLWASYRHALESGLSSSAPGTESY